MWITPAYAQDAGAAGVAMQIMPLVLIFVVFYFLLIRPQQKKAKEHKAMLAALKRGDRVLTSGGIIASVVKVKEGTSEVEVEIAPNVRVTVIRDTISAVLNPNAANDPKAVADAKKAS
jgi:preprotein translocase subunit YajC